MDLCRTQEAYLVVWSVPCDMFGSRDTAAVAAVKPMFYVGLLSEKQISRQHHEEDGVYLHLTTWPCAIRQ